jgi:phosphomannomutase
MTNSGTKTLIRLQCAVQHYAWGDPDFIPILLGTTNAERTPFAELWIGAHPDAPSQALLNDKAIPLNELIASEPERILHRDVAARFGAHLPFLMKVLGAAAPLSLQAHPNKAAAEEGFAREERAGLPLNARQRNYRDRNHKPELIVALTDFYGLRGFRPLHDIALEFETTPEFRDLALHFQPNAASLREIYSQLMTWSQDRVDQTLRPLMQRLDAEHQRKAFTRSNREYWLLRADREYSRDGHHDRGLFSIYLLNLVHLRPGEGMYLPSGILHAYLEGAAVEIMANSNNVLRGGLTPKHVDVAELLKNVTFEGEEAEILTARPVTGSTERRFSTPADEFELSAIELSAHHSHPSDNDHSVEVFLITSATPDARLTLKIDGGTETFQRGAAFLITAGTPYELSADSDITAFKTAVPLTEVPRPLNFRGRQATELRFGTSGLRGLVTDITDLEAYINARGFLDYLLQIGDVERGDKVSLACDLRPSSDGDDRSIVRAVSRGIEDTGLVVDHVGRLPTPALTFYAMQECRPSIMVTGSHIPFDRNGIKFNKRAGEVLKDDEPAILRAVRRVRAAEYTRAESDSAFDDAGMFKTGHLPGSLRVNPEAHNVYARRYIDFFRKDALEGLRIVFYEHSAVGRNILVEILSALGAHVVPMRRSESFVPLDTEAISDDKLRILQEMGDEARRNHGRLDAIVSTDGDSDRPLLAGVAPDGQVTFFPGDLLGILAAEFLNADAVVTPISVSDAVDRWAAPRHITIRKTRIGSPYVIEGMHHARREGSVRTVGFEANGGFLTGSDIECDGRGLKALPTRDAALPLLAVLSMANEHRTSVTELFARLPRRFSKAGLLDNFPPETGRAVIARFTPETQSELEEFFGPEAGFGRIRSLNVLDGVRITFDNGDIAHIRPSGNAPQLRIYAVADSPERASQIVESALREPDGILRRIEARVVGKR